LSLEEAICERKKIILVSHPIFVSDGKMPNGWSPFLCTKWPSKLQSHLLFSSVAPKKNEDSLRAAAFSSF
jgi:hypothetical protein